MKLSFKKHPKETGLRAVGNPYPFVDIKGDKKKVGWIQPKNYHTPHFTIWFHVKTDDDNWRNMQLKWMGETEQQARDFIKEYWTIILEKYTLQQLED